MPLGPILVNASLFRTPSDRARSQLALVHLLDALTAMNVDYLKAYPDTPPIYKSGVRYNTEVDENWKAIPDIIKDGEGDCEDLACWRAAELIMRGYDAMPVMTYKRIQRDGAEDFFLYHVTVLVNYRGRKIRLDPSRALGMGKERDNG